VVPCTQSLAPKKRAVRCVAPWFLAKGQCHFMRHVATPAPPLKLFHGRPGLARETSQASVQKDKKERVDPDLVCFN